MRMASTSDFRIGSSPTTQITSSIILFSGIASSAFVNESVRVESTAFLPILLRPAFLPAKAVIATNNMAATDIIECLIFISLL